MEVKPSYRQTDVGVIPEDWHMTALDDIGHVIRGASPRPKGDKRFYGGTIPRLMVEDITRDKHWVFPSIDYLTDEGAQRSRFCKKGTLTVVCSGTPAAVGLPALLAVDACIHDGILALVQLEAGVSGDFLFHQLSSLQQRLHAAATHGGTFVNLTTEAFRAFKVALPPTKTEQEAIAKALSDADAVITSLEQLIAKKRHLKQGAMLELLRPTDEWMVKRLGNTAILKARIGWQGLTTAEYLDSGDFYLVTGTDFDGGYVDWSNCHYVEESRYNQDKYIQLKDHDVLVTKDGTIGKVALVTHLDTPATLNSGIFVIRPIENAFNPGFFYYLLCSRLFTDFLDQLSAGSTINHLYQKDFVNFVYETPASLEEQIAITAVLSDMDAEIATLEAKLSKARTLKQGMMQELLTGRIRLV
jgi:type I restriction enzyme S subunit